MGGFLRVVTYRLDLGGANRRGSSLGFVPVLIRLTMFQTRRGFCRRVVLENKAQIKSAGSDEGFWSVNTVSSLAFQDASVE